MKYCPNRQCPYALKHAQPGEYVDEVATCSDCGTDLSLTPPVLGHPVRVTFALPWSKLAVTLLAFAVPFVLPYFLLPGVKLEGLAQEVARSSLTKLSPFALGIMPFLSAFVCVELVALAIPHFRPLRVGGPRGRARLLSAVWQLAYVFCFVQAFSIAAYLQRTGFLEPGRSARLWAVLSLVAGTSLLVLFTQLLQSSGLGGGFSVLYVAFLAPRELVSSVGALYQRAQVWPKGIDLAALASIAVVIASIVVLRWRPRDVRGIPSPVRIPACGLVPLVISASLLSLLALVGSYLDSVPSHALYGDSREILTSVFLVALLSLGFGVLFNRPSKVWAAGSDPQGSPSIDDTRLTVRRAVLWSAVFVLILQLIQHFVAAAVVDLPLIGVVPLVMLAAVSLDVLGEFRAMRQHGELVAVWPEHRVYAVDRALAALERAGIPAFPRGLHHRTLWHFYAPFIPVDIMVPKSRREEAGAILHSTIGEGSFGSTPAVA